MEQVETSAPKTIWQKVETVFFLLSLERRKNTVQKKKRKFLSREKTFLTSFDFNSFSKNFEKFEIFFYDRIEERKISNFSFCDFFSFFETGDNSILTSKKEKKMFFKYLKKNIEFMDLFLFFC
jgi:hypothetical protein